MQGLNTTLAYAEHVLMRVLNHSTHTKHMPSISVQAIDFDNPAVARATNPLTHGYHHGEYMHNAS
jgi:hypothetical protein